MRNAVFVVLLVISGGLLLAGIPMLSAELLMYLQDLSDQQYIDLAQNAGLFVLTCWVCFLIITKKDR